MKHHLFHAPLFLLTGLLLLSNMEMPLHAGEKVTQSSFSTHAGATLVSRHIWRGLEIGAIDENGATPHIQPFLIFGWKPSKLHTMELGLVGTYGFNNRYSESDFYLNYSLNTPAGMFHLGLFDYHYPFRNIPFSDFSNDGSGAHTLELSAAYTLPGRFPGRLFIARNVHNYLPGDHTLYIETALPITHEAYTLTFVSGLVRGRSNWYGVSSRGWQWINAGVRITRLLQIHDLLQIPVSVAWTYNPYHKKSYLAVSLSI